MEGENTAKAVLRPRRPGETIKVAQTVLKRRDRNLKANAERAQEISRIKKQQKRGFVPEGFNLVRAEKFVADNRKRMRDRKRVEVQTKKSQKKKVKLGKGKVLAVGRNGRLGKTAGEKASAVIKGINLSKRHTMVFVRNNEDTIKRLETAKPFLFWGEPQFKTIFNLMTKKAVFRDPSAEDGSTVLSDNTLVEKHLGDLGVLCTEDLAHEIVNPGKLFEQVVGRLEPIPLGDAAKAHGLLKETKLLSGSIKGKIDEIVAKLLGQ